MTTAAGDWVISIDFGTALAKAAAGPRASDRALDEVRPLALGRPLGLDNPFFAPAAMFLHAGRVLFGAEALANAAGETATGREALQSFKLLLAAPDMPAVLESYPPRTIDPERRFRRRDLVVLFLAYLTRLIRLALAEIGLDGVAARAEWRYAVPAFWRDGGPEHALVSRLFDEADDVSQALGPLLTLPGGAPADAAMGALEGARAAPARPSKVGAAVFEAAAVAASHAIGAVDGRRRAFVVIDMGAGTTDLGALTVVNGRVGELMEARRSLMVAGDALDRMLLNIALERLKRESLGEKSAVWRTLMLSVRETKELAFANGKAAMRLADRVLVVEARAIERRPEFRALLQAIGAALQDALDIAARSAEAAGAEEVTIILAGGGARLKFLQNMAREARPRRSRVRVRLAPAAPAWVDHPRFEGRLAPLFPQLAIALGGALAPRPLLWGVREPIPGAREVGV